jgi:hypothetical protein
VNPVKEACPECPFRKTATPGWLGAASSPEEFLGPHYHGTTRLPCHMQVDWESENAQLLAQQAPLCRGFLHFVKNSCKRLDNQEMQIAANTVEPDRDNFLSFPHGFCEHHGKAIKS